MNWGDFITIVNRPPTSADHAPNAALWFDTSSSNQQWVRNGDFNTGSWVKAGAQPVGGGAVFGPAGATNNALVVWDGATGTLIKNSVIISTAGGDLSGLGNITGAGALTMTGNVTGGNITTAGVVAATGTVTGSNLSGTNSGDVSLAGAPTYLTLAGQVITQHAIDLSTGNVTGNLGVSHLNSGTSAGNTTYWRGDATWGSPFGELIGTATPNGVNTVTFSAIPSKYNHLLLVISGRSDAGASPDVNIQLTLNNDTGANYDFMAVQTATNTAPANVGLAAQTGFPGGKVPWSGATASMVGGGWALIFNIQDTNLFKHAEGGRATIGAAAVGTPYTQTSWGGQYRSTTAITRVDAVLATGNFVAGSRASLYGLF